MNKTALEWEQKALNDLSPVEREILVQNNPNYDAVCYHSQQAAEKMMRDNLFYFPFNMNSALFFMAVKKSEKTETYSSNSQASKCNVLQFSDTSRISFSSAPFSISASI